MQNPIAGSSLDTLLFGMPLLSLLVFGFFRLDTVFAAQKRSALALRRAPSGVDPDGMPILTDPDGRPSGKPRRNESGGRRYLRF